MAPSSGTDDTDVVDQPIPPSTTGLLDLLIVTAKHKTLVIGIPAVASVIAVILCLLMPNIFTATAKMLPPQQSPSSAAGLLGQLSALTGAAGGGGVAGGLGMKSPHEIYVGMLRSRSVADNLIQRFDLKKVYGQETFVDTRIALASATLVLIDKEGLLVLEVSDKDPKLAADLANGYVQELYKLTQTLAVTEASHRRLFFEKQLKQTKEALAVAEMAFRQSAETTGIIKLDDQGKAIIESIARLRAMIAAKEVELATMRTFATDRNPGLLMVQQEIAGLRVQLGKLERDETRAGDILVPSRRIPEVGLEYARRFRDVKYHETMFELLAKQFELAKIDEAKDSSTIQVIDDAVVPEKKSRPHKRLIVLVTGVVSLLLAILLAFVLEAAARARSNPEVLSRLDTFRYYLGWRRR
jgi:uncharacterized protein involved in exopolysaccharide biosynthesis